jgi:hypothetical protein
MALVSDAGPSRKAESATLPLLRFDDLRAQEIVRTWTTLNLWIDERGFPPGRMIGRNRMWTTAEVMRWVEAQPTAKAKLRGAALVKEGGAR